MHRKRRRNWIWIPVLAAVVALAAGAWRLRPLVLGTSSAPARGHSGAEFGIAAYASSCDADGDGVDDQTDVLQSARAYLATEPAYASRYYAGGYPDDGCGVCTDVVAFALRGAGYDLMALVAADVAAAPEAYAIATPDANIDFRRAANLRVWFARNAESLTTDAAEIAQWQGGDVVIFENHIGIVSDQRNRDGVPYVLHHSGRLQIAYEEDILPGRDDLVGHYRLTP